MLPKDQLVDLANKVLPKLHDDDDDDDDDNNNNKGSGGGGTTVSAGDVQQRQLCRLWAGMGHIYLVTIKTKQQQQRQFVIKHVTPPSLHRQSFGDHRKAQSYQVEANFYKHLAATLRSDFNVHIPKPFAVQQQQHGSSSSSSSVQGEIITICMSYLKQASSSSSSLDDFYDTNSHVARKTLTWLAKFHASHWGTDIIDEVVERVGLQRNGGYWHLDTRPDEHDNMPRRGWEGRLKRAARAIDACMKRDSMQCLIHGDPKDANVMLVNSSAMSNISSNTDDDDDNNNKNERTEVAMYDFQYCGKGTSTRDLTYFLCSSCDDDDEEELVQYYYEQLLKYLDDNKSVKVPPTMEHFQQSLELAYADYCRFMAGWGYWGFDIRGRVQRFLDQLDGGKDLGSEEAYDEAIRKVLW